VTNLKLQKSQKCDITQHRSAHRLNVNVLLTQQHIDI